MKIFQKYEINLIKTVKYKIKVDLLFSIKSISFFLKFN